MGDTNTPEVREAIDADDHPALKADPQHADAKLDVAIDESFPTSDAPSQTRPGTSEPAVSSGFDEAAEQRIQDERAREAGSGVTVEARFRSRRQADLAIEQLVQDKGFERTDIFVSAAGSDASSGTAADGADVESGHPGVELPKEPTLEGEILLSIDLASATQQAEITALFEELEALSVTAR